MTTNINIVDGDGIEYQISTTSDNPDVESIIQLHGYDTTQVDYTVQE